MNLLYFLFVIFILSWFPIEILDVESDGFVIYKIFCFDFQNGIYIFDRVIQKMVNLLYFLFVIYLIVILNRNLGCRISDEFVVYRIFYFDFQSRIYIYIYIWPRYIWKWWIFYISWSLSYRDSQSKSWPALSRMWLRQCWTFRTVNFCIYISLHKSSSANKGISYASVIYKVCPG